MYTNIKSFEDACKDQGKDPAGVPDYSKCGLSPARERFHMSVFEFEVIAFSINKDDGEEWKPKPTDERWSCWMWIEEDGTKRFGFGLSLSGVDCGRSYTGVASRLTFRDEPRARYMFETFPQLHEDIFIFQS